MPSYTLTQVAEELGVPAHDVFVVAEVELTDPDLYDTDEGTVSEEGRQALITHFLGGTDPTPEPGDD